MKNKVNNIHWFPGHMKKGVNQIIDKLKNIDVVIEIVDARIPFSSLNKQLENQIKDKPKLLLFSKADLCDINQLNKWKEYYQNLNYVVLSVNLKDKKHINNIISNIKLLAKQKTDKLLNKGIKNYQIKTMIIGIPNVGKSTLINALAKRNAAKVQDSPGITRSQQFIKIDQNIILMDTPGILPTNYENKEIATKIALIGSIRQDILPIEDLTNYLLDFLRINYPNALENRFNISNINDISNIEILNLIANKRNFKIKDKQYDINKAKITLLNEFKDGTLGKYNLDIYKDE